MRHESNDIETPRADWGFFGPDSMPWRLLADDPVVFVGATYATFIFELYPPCAVLTDKVGSLYRDPVGRARATADYVYAVVFGDSPTAYRVAEPVRRVHNLIEGTWPATGRTYRPADPENLVWLHMTWGEGLLRAHQAYGPKALGRDEIDRFWREFVPFAMLQGAPRELIPASAEQAEAYMQDMTAKFALTSAGRRAVRQVLAPQIPATGVARTPAAWLARAFGESAVALLDDDVRRLVPVSTPQRAAPAARAASRVLLGGLRRADRLLPPVPLAYEAGTTEYLRAMRARDAWVADGRPPAEVEQVDQSMFEVIVPKRARKAVGAPS